MGDIPKLGLGMKLNAIQCAMTICRCALLSGSISAMRFEHHARNHCFALVGTILIMHSIYIACRVELLEGRLSALRSGIGNNAIRKSDLPRTRVSPEAANNIILNSKDFVRINIPPNQKYHCRSYHAIRYRGK